MSLLILSQYFYPQNYRINLITKELLKKKYPVKVLSSIYGKKNEIYREFGTLGNFEFYGIRCYKVKEFKNLEIIFNYLTFYLNAFIFIILNKKKLKTDKIFIFQPSPIFIGLIGIFLKYLFKNKIYLWVLDLWPDTLYDYNIVTEKSILGRVLKFITLKVYQNSNIIFIHSKTFQKQVKSYSNNKIVYLPSPAEDIFTNYNLKKFNSNNISILFAGNIGKSQTFDNIIKILSKKEYSNITLKVLGDGRGLNKLKEKTNHLKNIIFINRVAINSVNKYYNECDFFYLSLINLNVFRNTVPGKFQSYLKFGKPIIAVINGETNKLIKKYDCGYAVNNGDLIGLEMVLKKITNLNQTDFTKFCANCKKAYKLNYEKKIIINRLISYF